MSASSQQLSSPFGTRGWRRVKDALLLLRVAVFVALTPLLLRLNLKRLLALIDCPNRQQVRTDAGFVGKLERYTDAVIHRLRPLIGSYCLSRGLTLFFFLRRAGLTPTIHFGIGKVEGDFAGHCWLELGGEPYLEKEASTPAFRSVYSYPSQLSEEYHL